MREASGRTPAKRADALWEHDIRVTARGHTTPVPAAVVCGIFALYFLVEAFEPFSPFRLVLGIATAALAVRLSSRGTLVASRDGIRWHTMTRTWRWPYSAIEHFELAPRKRPSGPPVRVVRVHLVDGTARWLGALEDLPTSETEPPARRLSCYRLPGYRLPGVHRPPDPPPSLDEAVGQLNGILTDLRGGSRALEAG